MDNHIDGTSSQSEILSSYDLDYFLLASKVIGSSLSKLWGAQKLPSLQKRQDMRMLLEEIDKEIVSVLALKMDFDGWKNPFLWLWMALENQISSNYQMIFRSYLIHIREALADLQATDTYKPTKYNDKIIALDALVWADSAINFPILHNQIVHFLIELYHICNNDEGSISLLEWIKDYITVLWILPRFTGINVEDHIWNYPLNRALLYQKELDNLSWNDLDLKRINEIPQRKLKELVSVLMESGAMASYTREQKTIAAEIDTEIRIEAERAATIEARWKNWASIYNQYWQSSVVASNVFQILNKTTA